MIDMLALQRVNQQMKKEPRIQEIVIGEPKVLELFQLAAMQVCRAERWRLYEMLKYIGSQYIGKKATKPELHDPELYCLMVETLDALLPLPEYEDELPGKSNRREAIHQLQVDIAHLFPHIALPTGLQAQEERR